MIVHRSETEWIVVRQADHARLAGEMLALVRLPELIDHPRREALLRAISEHDNGWWEEDAAVRLEPTTGGPVDFRSLPAAARRQVWSRGIERWSARDPYVAALIAGHVLRLTAAGAGDADQADGPGARDFRADLTARQIEHLAAAGVEAVAAAADDRWLRLGDELSLVAATRDPGFLVTPGWTCEVAEREGWVELSVAPFPWAGATRFQLDLRRLPKRGYRSSSELGSALVGARSEQETIRLVPPGGET